MTAKMLSTILFKQNYHTTANVVVNQGGTGSGKTYAILQVLFCIACQISKQFITIAGQDIPNLKAGALRDACAICEGSQHFSAMLKSYNRSDRVFEFKNGTIMEFKSYDDAQDAKSGKRDFLFVNEANGIPWNVYFELALRTRTRVFIDYNPNNNFWVHEKVIGQKNTQLIISDHRHNPYMATGLREKIEALKDQDYELWKVYARGLTGKITGLVFNNWHICEDIPTGARRLAAGLDFGYTNDQTGCIEVYRQNGELWVDELLYETGLTNSDISFKLKSAGLSKNTELIADSAEPKSIEELQHLGWNIKGAQKGPDSIQNSIDILKRYKINVTRRSVNLRKELDRYKWKTDRSGKTVNEPVDSWNHLIDPLRYIALNKLNIKNVNKPKSHLPYLTAGFQDPIVNFRTS